MGQMLVASDQKNIHMFDELNFFGQMPLASDHMNSSCKYQRSQISLNIHFTGIHALANLFSVIFHEKRDQNEISRPTLNF